LLGKKRLIVTVFAIISILFGLSGAILSFIGFWELNSLREDFYNMDNIGMSVAGVIEETARMLEKSDETFGNIADSIMSTNDTIDYASEISNDSGVAFNKIAGITDFDILGFKPFSGAKEFFNDVGNNLIGLSEELKNSHKNLKINASDIRSIGDDLEKISVELEEVYFCLFCYAKYSTHPKWYNVFDFEVIRFQIECLRNSNEKTK